MINNGQIPYVEGDDDDEVMTLEEIKQFMQSEITLFESSQVAAVDHADEVSKDGNAPAISEGDFINPAQRAIFVALKKHIRTACGVNSKQDKRIDALDWIFIPSRTDADQLDFSMACIALCARPMIVRARVAHKLWEAGIIIGRPLPFLAALPPSSLMGEIEVMLGGKELRSEHADVARAIWEWPSIHSEELRAQFTHLVTSDFVTIINDLLAEGYIGVNSARFYFISRNPANLTTQQRAHWQFAASIMGDT